MEYYFPEDRNISLSAEASTAVIAKQITENFSNYKKLLVQIDQQTKDTPDYLYFNIRGSGTTSTNPEGYLVFYGVREWMDLVPPQIYDHALETGMFSYKNGKMKMNMDLDLNGNSLINSDEDFFYLKGFYNSSSIVQPELVRSTADGDPPIWGIYCNCYLIEVFILITSVAPNNDYKFKLNIFAYTSDKSIPSETISLSSTNNSKFYRFMNFKPPYFQAQKRNAAMRLWYDNRPNRVKFPTATFLFKFFKETNF